MHFAVMVISKLKSHKFVWAAVHVILTYGWAHSDAFLHTIISLFYHILMVIDKYCSNNFKHYYTYNKLDLIEIYNNITL